MSTQHTQDRLIVTTQDDFPTGCANFESRGMSGVDYIVLYHDNAKADARRIVACWNACEGIPTTALEGGAADILEHSMQLMAQRNELLAALRLIESAEPSEHALQYCKGIARAAIAKATGGQS